MPGQIVLGGEKTWRPPFAHYLRADLALLWRGTKLGNLLALAGSVSLRLQRNWNQPHAV
jgi:hypothetical protein